MTNGVAVDRIKSFVERLENLENEKIEISAQIKDVLAEAKGEGFDTKILRKVIALRKMRDHDRLEQEGILELYKGALGM